MSTNRNCSSKLITKCSAYLTQLLQPSFDLILIFFIDLVRLLANFSLQFQKKHLFVNEYFNLVEMLKEILSNVDLCSDISTMEVDQRFIFRNICKAAQAGPTDISGLRYILRRGSIQTTFKDCISTAINRCKRFVQLLRANTEWFWYEHYYWKHESNCYSHNVQVF